MLSTIKEAARIETHISVDNYAFEVVQNFVYLGSSITTNSNVSIDIKRSLALANRYYLGLNRQLNSRTLFRRTKLTLYKTLIIPILLHGTLTAADEKSLGAFERKILRKISDPICVNGEYR